MTINQSIEEAKCLKEVVEKISNITFHMPNFNESEVSLRAKTLRGFVVILQNDIFNMIQEWEAESQASEKVV